jgi:protein subunit release factor A
MNDVVVEIRAAEGGDDSKGLVIEQFRCYMIAAKRRGL